MWTMATSSMTLFFRGKLFADPAKAYRQLAIGIAVTAILHGPAGQARRAALGRGAGRRAASAARSSLTCSRICGTARGFAMNVVDHRSHAPHRSRRASRTTWSGSKSIFATWDETPRGAVEAYRRAIEALHGEALRGWCAR